MAFFVLVSMVGGMLAYHFLERCRICLYRVGGGGLSIQSFTSSWVCGLGIEIQVAWWGACQIIN